MAVNKERLSHDWSVLEWLYANWRVIVLCVRSLDPTLFLARYDILFWLLRAHQKSVLCGLFRQRVQGMYKPLHMGEDGGSGGLGVAVAGCYGGGGGGGSQRQRGGRE